MSQTYNTLEGELTIQGKSTIVRAGDENQSIALVGGYNKSTADGSVVAGESTVIGDPANAEDTFGDSELARAASAAGANNGGTQYGVPVPETETTESFTGTQSMTLSNAPVFDPNLHPDHAIEVTDTSGGIAFDVNIVYDETVSTPSESETANVNPIIGAVETSTSSDFDVDYTYGDYQSAIETAVDQPVRYVIVLTESPAVKATLTTQLNNVAADFDFKRGVTGARPEIDVGSISSYTPDEQHWRMVEVAPSRATGASGAVRTAAAVGGFLASQPLGPDGSILYDPVNGLASLNTEYRSSEVQGFNGITTLTRNTIVGSATTTSTTEQFTDIYATEIIDDVAQDLFATARDYAGGPQDLPDLRALMETVCIRKSRGNPPKLGFGDGREANPYDVTVEFGTTNDVAVANVSIVPYPIAEEVNVNVTVTDGYVAFEGAQ